MPNPSNIYFVRGLDSGLVKVGASHHLPARLHSLANQWESIELFASVRAMPSLEWDLHAMFAALREPSRGREWFRDDGSIAALAKLAPAAQRGSWKFMALTDMRPLRHATTNELLFPSRPFPASALRRIGAGTAADPSTPAAA